MDVGELGVVAELTVEEGGGGEGGEEVWGEGVWLEEVAGDGGAPGVYQL